MPFANDREKCAHLLRRFGMGASEAELDFYMRDGLTGAVDRLLDESIDDGFDLTPEQFLTDNGRLNMPIVLSLWISRMLVSRRPLHEKMTIFWHDHFATSASKVTNTAMMLNQNLMLRSNAVGSFRKLLTDVSKDPAMLLWLDNQENLKGKPNENFAREVMELFTLGIGNYSEKDVQEAARAFTGWSVRRGAQDYRRGLHAQFQFRPLMHDNGAKTVLGKTGNLSGEDVLDLLCDLPRTSEYLTHKIWDWFVWANPDEATIAPFARRFRESGLDIKSLLKDIMRSSEFYSPRAVRTIVKNPVDFCVSTLRQLGVGEQMTRRIGEAGDAALPRTVLGPASIAQTSMKKMGMWLMYPPDVDGWANGPSWITSATMVERIGWADKVFGSGAIRQVVRYPAFGLFQENTSAEGVVDKLLSVFDAPLKPEKRASLIAAANNASGGRVTPQNAVKTAAQVSRLIFASPEFQFC